MVRIPSFTRRSDAPTTVDENTDGRIAERTGAATGQATPRHAAGTAVVEPDPGNEPDPANEPGPANEAGKRNQVDDRTVYRSRAAAATDAATAEQAAKQAGAERAAADRAEERTAEERRDAATDETATTRPAVIERPVEEPPVEPAPARRPRTSIMATLGLALGVVAALGVLSGKLAAYGVAIGAVALILSIAGLAATGRRHVAGKGDALLGLLLSLGAVVVGVLALTGVLPWLSTDTDTVSRVRDWLDGQWSTRF